MRKLLVILLMTLVLVAGLASDALADRYRRGSHRGYGRSRGSHVRVRYSRRYPQHHRSSRYYYYRSPRVNYRYSSYYSPYRSRRYYPSYYYNYCD